MKNRGFALLILMLGAVIQQLSPPWPLFGGMKPPILAALAVHYALRRDNRDMWLVAIVAALFQDGLEPGVFGPALLAFPVVGVLANRVRTEVFADGLVTQMFFGAAVGVFCCFMALLVHTITGQRPFHMGLTLVRLLGSLALGALTLPVVSRAVSRLEALLPKRRSYGWQ